MVGWPAVIWWWTKGVIALCCLSLGFFYSVVEPHYAVAAVCWAVSTVFIVSIYHQWRHPDGLFLESALVLSIPRERRRTAALVMLVVGVGTYLFLGVYLFPFLLLLGLMLALGGWLIYLHRNVDA